MTKTQISTRLLMDEVRRYLAAVDVFRAEGHEPQWAAERLTEEPQRARHPRLLLRLDRG
jgi:hypothetical protein